MTEIDPSPDRATYDGLCPVVLFPNGEPQKTDGKAIYSGSPEVRGEEARPGWAVGWVSESSG